MSFADSCDKVLANSNYMENSIEERKFAAKVEVLPIAEYKFFQTR